MWTIRLRDSLIVSAVSAAFLLGLEGGLRVLYPEKAALWEAEYQEELQRYNTLAFEFDARALVSLRPNVQKSFTRTDGHGPREIPWKTNALGFRGLPIRRSTEYGARIIVYGDSNVQARFSILDETFPVRLGTYLQTHLEEPVDVINAGLVGAGPDQSYLRFLSNIQAGLRPDVAVFHIYADNDFGDIVRNRLVELDGSGNLVRTGHRLTLDERLQPPENRWIDRLYLPNALQKLLRVALEKPKIEQLFDASNAEFDVYARGLPRRFSHFLDHYDIDLATEPGMPSARVKTALMEALLRKIRSTAMASDIYLVVVVQPSTRDLTKKRSPNFEDFEAYPGYSRGRLSSLVEQICSRLGIPVVNLYTRFRVQAERLYLDGNDHWNEKGQDVAAQLTAEHLAESFFALSE